MCEVWCVTGVVSVAQAQGCTYLAISLTPRMSEKLPNYTALLVVGRLLLCVVLACYLVLFVKEG